MKKTVLLIVAFIVGTVASCTLRPAAPQTYHNPVLPGDFPDPSVIRVGREYWATATTSDWAPLFPLLRSRDLVHWDLTGAVFQKRPSWSVGNYWAPEISEHKGRFYVYFVGRQKGGPLSIAVATADHPGGPYTDHGPLIGQAAGSIDPVTAIDEKGDRYLIWKEDGNSRKQPTPIWAQKLSYDGTRLIGEMKELFRNDAPWEGNLVEGPFLKKRSDWFYVFYSGNACCGRQCNYALGVARAKSLFGPWEKNPANPILAANEHWKCPGHGSIVSDPEGNDFLLYHAYDASTFVYVGRQGLLDKITWIQDGWPVINEGRGPSVQAPSPQVAKDNTERGEFFDGFSKATLDPHWQWPQANEPVVRLDAAAGMITLSAPPEQVAEFTAAVLAVQTTAADYVAITCLDPRSLTGDTAAGLSAFGDSANALGASVQNGKIVTWRLQKNEIHLLATNSLPNPSKVQLRCVATGGHRFRFAASGDGRNWSELGNAIDLEGDYLPPWDRGVRVAITVGGRAGANARFDWLRVTPQHLPR